MVDLNSNYKIVTFSIGDTKAGTKMGKLQLKCLNDESILNCILWEETLNRIEEKTFRQGNIIKLTGASYNDKYNNCLVSSVELVEEAKMGIDKEETERLFKYLLDVINSFKKEKRRDFILKLFNENEEKIKIAPAAKSMHHNFAGGLLVHTTECVDFAKHIFPKLKNVDEEELIAACILHDIGKIHEYNINLETGLIDYNDSFSKEWISHTQYAYSLCMLHNEKRIAKMIAAHHSRAEWGALIDLNEKDLEPYVYIVHHIDDLSAKFGKTDVSMI